MEIKFSKTAGSEDFHQELIDVVSITYLTLNDLIQDLCINNNEFCLKRTNKDGFLYCSIQMLDLRNEIVTLDWVGVGG